MQRFSVWELWVSHYTVKHSPEPRGPLYRDRRPIPYSAPRE